jgi:Flp pilus assembly pilin Flp
MIELESLFYRQGLASAMKTLFARFVEDQSGAIDFEDGLTAVSLTVGFIAAFALLNGTFVRLYEAIFSLLPGVR